MSAALSQRSKPNPEPDTAPPVALDPVPPLVLDRETAFHRARREMLLAYRAWVVTDPDPRDLAAETEATIAALRQMQGAVT